MKENKQLSNIRRSIKVSNLVHNPPYQGGIVQYCILLVNSLTDLNAGIDINCIGFKSLYPPFFYKGKLPKENKSAIQFKVPIKNYVTWYNPFSWIKAYKDLSKTDIIHMQWVSPLLAPLQFTILKLNKWFAKKKTVLTCHNIEPHESTVLDRIFTKMVFNNIDHFVVHAEQNKPRIINEWKKKESHVHVVPHGTFGFFTQYRAQSRQELRIKLGLENKKVILFFGYIRKYKGLRFLLQAMPEVIKEIDDVILVIAGELWEPWNEYKKIINKYNLSDYVRVYPEYVDDKKVYEFFDSADICVLPYHNTEQTISGPLLVSLAFGLPTIISPVGGVKELIQNNQNGVLVEGGNPQLLAASIIKLMQNKEILKTMREKALLTTKDHTWDKVAIKYSEIYNKILE